MGDIHRPTCVPLRSRISFLVLERGTLHASHHALELVRETGTVTIPCGMATVLLLEPGVTVTHAAVTLCAAQGTLLIWVGEASVHVYASGEPGRAAGDRILAQARRRLRPRSRIAVARRFYERMFDEDPPQANDIEQLRGMEGARVRALYQEIATLNHVVWSSRDTAPRALQDALGFATSALYGVSEAVILAAGYSPGIGFIHSGDRRSLVFDLADTVKFKTVVPVAFQVYAQSAVDVRTRVRRACRDAFRELSVIDTLMDNLLYAMGEA